jgi:hypothetical protein
MIYTPAGITVPLPVLVDVMVVVKKYAPAVLVCAAARMILLVLNDMVYCSL